LYKNNKIPVYVFGPEPGQLPRVAGPWNRPCPLDFEDEGREK